MDILAHALWTNAAYYKKYKIDRKNRLWAILFGILPDLASFSPVFIYAFLTHTGFLELINKKIWPVTYASTSYQYTHSLVIFALAFLIITAVRKWKIWWPMFGWMLHICIDIFTHKGFYETPFLFPISKYKFDHGVSWAEPHFMAINYSALIAAYLIIFFLLEKRLEKKE